MSPNFPLIPPIIQQLQQSSRSRYSSSHTLILVVLSYSFESFIQRFTANICRHFRKDISTPPHTPMHTLGKKSKKKKRKQVEMIAAPVASSSLICYLMCALSQHTHPEHSDPLAPPQGGQGRRMENGERRTGRGSWQDDQEGAGTTTAPTTHLMSPVRPTC